MLDAAATSSETDAQAKKPKPNKNRHKLPGSNVLFEFACDKNSELGTVGSEHGVKVYRLCKEDFDLEDPESIEQLIQQVKALPGCSILARLNASHGPSGNVLISVSIQDCLQASVKNVNAVRNY